MIRVAVLLAALLLLVNGCNTASCACIPTLQVFGASSLAAALEDVATTHPGFYSNVHFVVSTGSSTALRTQIEQSPVAADVFLSADSANPAALVDAGLVAGSIVSFATNRLAIVVPRGNPGQVASAADLSRPGLRVIAAGEGVPITRYADQLVSKLAARTADPTAFTAAYLANIVTREDNVGAVVSKIALGEGDAAIVYATDASASDLPTIEIPDHAQVTTTYSGVVIAHERTRKYASEFLQWLRGQDGQRILAAHGFSPAP
jgi:molybdate transport system substrate-binding protein